jgi:CRISPR-associated protein Csm3
MTTNIRLFGRIFFTMNVKAITGLHIGGSGADLEIGGLDKEVIRDPLTNEPYIPGSSLRGKMRSQIEKYFGRPITNRHLGIHTCNKDTYDVDANGFKGCPVCYVFGVPAGDFASATRLTVRDIKLHPNGLEELKKLDTDLRYTELKTEVAIDRVTSAATPRTIERVPAGAVFGPAELVFGVYDAADFARVKVMLDALQLVEDDYLGGSGSRGSGKVKFEEIRLYLRNGKDYSQPVLYREQPFDSVQEVAQEFEKIQQWMKQRIQIA